MLFRQLRCSAGTIPSQSPYSVIWRIRPGDAVPIVDIVDTLRIMEPVQSEDGMGVWLYLVGLKDQWLHADGQM